jgi:hypothetical protein
MDAPFKIASLFGVVFILLTMMANFLMRNFPHIPGDIYINRPNLSIYIPFTSSIVLTVALTILFNYFFKY